MTIQMPDIDIAKKQCQLHGVVHGGKAVLKKRISRDKLAAFLSNLTNFITLIPNVTDCICTLGCRFSYRLGCYEPPIREFAS